jgi:hypothetical protein
MRLARVKGIIAQQRTGAATAHSGACIGRICLHTQPSDKSTIAHLPTPGSGRSQYGI